jgi:hypothetical protein
MDDDDAVTRQMYVEFEPVGAERQAVVERGERILRPERGASPVRIHQRAVQRCQRQGPILPGRRAKRRSRPRRRRSLASRVTRSL